jgi:hypothetical protein
MRDLYNRRKRLADWIKRVNENVDEPDRIDILKLLVNDERHRNDRCISTVTKALQNMI